MKELFSKRFLFIFIASVAIASICVSSAFANSSELYGDTYNLKREWLDNGSIYEYKNENFHGLGLARLIFAYELTGYYGNPGYKTWNWNLSASQVTLQEYEGSYSVAFGNPTWEENSAWALTNQSKRRTTIVYDHHNNMLDLNTGTNGWTEREKTIYENDGVTISEKFTRDSSGRLTESIVRSTGLRSTYSDYFTSPGGAVNFWRYKRDYTYPANAITALYEYEAYQDPAGALHHRLIKEVHVVASGYHLANTYYAYVYRTGVELYEMVHFKNVYTYTAGQEEGVLSGTVTGTLDASYEYVTSDYMVKRNSANPALATVITTLIKGSAGSWYTNTYLDLNPLSQSYNVLHIYNYDASWNITTIEKHYPNGVIEICAPNWVVTERKIPSGTFIKGVNLAWNNYGYDIGSTVSGDHYGFSRNIDALYQKMDPYKGMMVRLFLFTDLRAGMTFNTDGIPTGFTANVYEDMDALLACAQSLGIKVMPVLFDYLLGVKYQGGVWVRGDHADLIDNPVKRAALLSIMAEFIDHYKDNSAIYAWDVMNEPEWAHEFGSLVSMPAIYDFLREFAGMIKGKGEVVTVGNHDRTDLLAMVNYWISQGYTDPILLLYQFHYYSSMELENPLDCPAASLNLGNIPIIVGEVGSTDITNRLDILGRNGYLGGLFWQDGQPDTGENKISSAELTEIIDWLYDMVSNSDYTYTRYSSLPNRIESAKTVSGMADSFDNVYYHYINEPFYNNGTPANPDDDYGRTDVQIRAAADIDGTIAYSYEYFTGTSKIKTKRCYQTAAFINPSNPVLGNLLITYTFYELSGRLESKTMAVADAGGNIYYHYIDEAASHMDKSKRSAIDADGCLSYSYAYSVAGWLVTKTGYSDVNWTAFKVTYTYYDNTTNRIQTKEVVSDTTIGEFSSKRVKYYYRDAADFDNGTPADITDDYGRFTRIDNITDNYYYEFSYSATVASRILTKTRKIFTTNFLAATYTYEDSTTNRLLTELMAVTNASGEKYFTYAYSDIGITPFKKTAYTTQGGTLMNTYWYTDSTFQTVRAYLIAASGEYCTIESRDGSGRPTFVRTYSNAAGTIFAASYRMTYHGSTNWISQKTRYSDAAGVTLVETDAYYNNDTNRAQSKTLIEQDVYGNIYYRHIDENWNSTGLGRVDRQIMALADSDGARSYAYTYFTGLGQFQYKYCYSDTAFTTLVVVCEYNVSGIFIKKTMADGTVCTYYVSGKPESKTLTAADATGNIYYHYIDEAASRIDKSKRLVDDSDGCLSYDYAYSGSNTRVMTKRGYSDVNWTTLKVTQTYYDNTTNRIESKTLKSQDLNGNIYYHYIDEDILPKATITNVQTRGGNFRIQFTAVQGCTYEIQTSSDLINWTSVTAPFKAGGNSLVIDIPISSSKGFFRVATLAGLGYGRVDFQKLEYPDPDGAIGYKYTYGALTGKVVRKEAYGSIDVNNPANPIVSALKVTYTYYDNSMNRLESKALVSADTFGNTYYRYINENWNSTGFGRVDRQIASSRDADGTIGYGYEYYAGTTIVKIKRCYENIDYSDPSNPVISNPLWPRVLYTYYNNTPSRLESKTLSWGYNGQDIYYHWINEDYNAQGYGRLDCIVRARDGDQGIMIEYVEGFGRYERHYSSIDYLSNPSAPTPRGSVMYTEAYNTGGVMINKAMSDGTVYTYYNNANNRLESKTLAVADTFGGTYYSYIDENWNGQGYGRIVKSRNASGVETSWSYYLGSNRLQQKVSTDGTAAIYFDAGQTDPNDYKTETIWGFATNSKGEINQTITHWNSVADCSDSRYAYGKVAWLKGQPATMPNAVISIEVYTYYASGWVQYKDMYQLAAGVWTWQYAVLYNNSATTLTSSVSPFGTFGEYIFIFDANRVPLTFTLPEMPIAPQNAPQAAPLAEPLIQQSAAIEPPAPVVEAAPKLGSEEQTRIDFEASLNKSTNTTDGATFVPAMAESDKQLSSELVALLK